jgi:murein L,D-transpeptidase YafK
MQYSRVRVAYSEKEVTLKKELEGIQIPLNELNIFIRAFKKEKQLEIWVKKKSDTTYQYFKTYNFCSLSGTVGPKRKQGDGQTPEGIYHIDRFNPQSNFYLSLGINYPNASDKILVSSNPGGDIFIHGSCVTIGCIPITDEYIKELYLLCVEARNNGQLKIPVYLFPMHLTPENLQLLQKRDVNESVKKLWTNLKEVFDYFECYKKVPPVSVSSDGMYLTGSQ